MFQIFDAPASQNNIHEENNVTARKPVISNRKPLKDIETNKESVFDKQKVKNDIDDLKIDICSYKDVPDTYNDVMAPTNIDLLQTRKECITPIIDFEIEQPIMFEFNDFKFSNVELDLEQILCDLRMPDNLC